MAMAFVFALCILGTCNTTIELDELGLPIVDYGFVSPEGVSSETEIEGWTNVGKQRNPLTIAAQGLIVMLPPLVIALLVGKYIVRGLTLGAVK